MWYDIDIRFPPSMGGDLASQETEQSMSKNNLILNTDFTESVANRNSLHVKQFLKSYFSNGFLISN